MFSLRAVYSFLQPRSPSAYYVPGRPLLSKGGGQRGRNTDADPDSVGLPRHEDGRWQTHPGPVVPAAPEARRRWERLAWSGGRAAAASVLFLALDVGLGPTLTANETLTVLL